MLKKNSLNCLQSIKVYDEYYYTEFTLESITDRLKSKIKINTCIN